MEENTNSIANPFVLYRLLSQWVWGRLKMASNPLILLLSRYWIVFPTLEYGLLYLIVSDGGESVSALKDTDNFHFLSPCRFNPWYL
jgi:hypothetical protein